MKDVERDRRAQQLMIEKFGDVEADGRMRREPCHHGVARVVEHPGVLAVRRFAPARQARVHALGVGGIEEFDQP